MVYLFSDAVIQLIPPWFVPSEKWPQRPFGAIISFILRFNCLTVWCYRIWWIWRVQNEWHRIGRLEKGCHINKSLSTPPRLSKWWELHFWKPCIHHCSSTSHESCPNRLNFSQWTFLSLSMISMISHFMTVTLTIFFLTYHRNAARLVWDCCLNCQHPTT